MRALRALFYRIFGFGAKPTALVRPPSVSWILDRRAQLQVPASTKGDTPLAHLYRIYEYFVAGYVTGLRSEVEFFFNHPTWAIADIPDPEDPDPERYAVLAVLPHYMVRAFNRLIERGLPRGSPAIITGLDAENHLKSRPVVPEQEPEWVAKVPKLDKTITIPCTDGSDPSEDVRSERFMAMNIISEEPYIVFV